MRTAISFSAIDPRKEARLRELIGIRANRLGYRLALQPPDQVRLEGAIHASDGVGPTCVSLRLRWPGADLLAECAGEEHARAVNDAFDRLERRFERHQARSLREARWGATVRRPAAMAPRSRPMGHKPGHGLGTPG